MISWPKTLVKAIAIEEPQKEVLLSGAIIIVASLIIATMFKNFLVVHPFAPGITIFLTQYLITKSLSSKAHLIYEGRIPHIYQDKRHGKIFKKTSLPILGSGLAQIAFLFSCCTYENSFFTTFILLLPLIITRWILFIQKTPLSALYVV